jgi:phosphopantothenoylcysteine decarboxylase/phosphopantothenate--cysteine ligase
MSKPPTRLLITAGPTHEPIDAVRFLGNRSSGRMGVALASAAGERGWSVTLLLGPATVSPPGPPVRVRRFVTCEDLRGLLREEMDGSDVLVMAAAVADYRPKPLAGLSGGKFRRTSEALRLELEPTPDLLAEASGRRRTGQFFVGFALEPRAEMLASAKAKLERKGVDLVVANPLETMDSEHVEASLVSAGGKVDTPGVMSKRAFAPWLLDEIERRISGPR